MRKLMPGRQRIAVLLFVAFLAGCHAARNTSDANSIAADSGEPKQAQTTNKPKINRANLAKVKLGMTKQEVIQTMGQPYKFDLSLDGKKEIEKLYYITLKHRQFQRYSEKHMSKIVLENNQVVSIKTN